MDMESGLFVVRITDVLTTEFIEDRTCENFEKLRAAHFDEVFASHDRSAFISFGSWFR